MEGRDWGVYLHVVLAEGVQVVIADGINTVLGILLSVLVLVRASISESV